MTVRWYETDAARYLAKGLAGAALLIGIGFCGRYTTPQTINYVHELGTEAKKIEQKRLETLERITKACTQAGNCKDVAAVVEKLEQTSAQKEEKK